MQHPHRPTRREIRDGDLSRFVRSEEELDALLHSVQRTSFAPEEPLRPDAFGPMAPPPVPSERVNLDAIVARLSFSPDRPVMAGFDRTREAVAEASETWTPAGFDDVVRILSARPSRPSMPSLRTRARRAFRAWEIAAMAGAAFVLGSALTLGISALF